MNGLEQGGIKMKTSILISLSALTLSLVAVPVLAQERAARTVSTRSLIEITPFNL